MLGHPTQIRDHRQSQYELCSAHALPTTIGISFLRQLWPLEQVPLLFIKMIVTAET